MKSVKPLGNRVLVERSKPKTTARGILLPDSAQEKPKEGTIIAVGPGKLDENGKTIPLNVKIGDRILFTSYAGTEVKNTCENSSGCEGEYLILSEDEILGILVPA